MTVYSIHDHVSADLDGGPPDGLHGQGDEAGDGVRDGEVVHQVVHVCPALLVRSVDGTFFKKPNMIAA